MFYKQGINNIKVVILSLDGGLLDLNRLRFNYFKRICKANNINITKQQFEENLGNWKTMYNKFSLPSNISSDDINKLIERDLYEYAKLKPDSIKKEGTDELLQFFKQKGIIIAVISTHKTKRAIQYLQLSRLYDKVDFVIGGDSDTAPLPDSEIIMTIAQQMNCQSNEILVVANYPNLLYAANQCLMNVIYSSDLTLANDNVLPRVFKVARNNLEIINIFLFDRYDSMEMFSPLLGMSADMDIATLDNTYNRLLKEYSNDQQLIELVKNTYHYFFNEIVNRETTDINPKLFEDEDVDIPLPDNEFSNPDAMESLEQSIEEFLAQENKKDTLKIGDNIKQEDDKDFFSDNIVTQDDDFSKTRNAIGCNPQRLNELMDIINGNTVEDSNDSDEDIDLIDEEEGQSLISHISNFLYTIVVVSLVTFLGLLIFVGFEDYIYSPGIIASVIRTIADWYVNTVILIYKIIFNGLHSIISFIPNYSTLTNGNEVLSSMAIQLIIFIVFNLIIVYIMKFVYLLITKPEDVDE